MGWLSLRPMPMPLLTLGMDTTVILPTMVDTVDTTVDSMVIVDTMATDTGRGLLMLKPMPSLLLMLLLMPGMATTVIPTDTTVDTTVDTVDTTAIPILMPTIMERGLLMPRLSLLLMLMPGTDTMVIPDTTDTVIMDMVVITAGLMLVITDTVVGGNFLPIFLPRPPTELLEKKPLPQHHFPNFELSKHIS